MSAGSEVESLSVHVREDAVAVVRWDAARATSVEALPQTLAKIARDPAVRAAILMAQCHGDVAEEIDLERLRGARTAGEAEARCRRGHVVAEAIEGSRKPIVAAIQGPAIGAWLGAALACRGRVMSQDLGTWLGLREVHLGLLPEMSALQRLSRMAGLGAAIEYGLSGGDIGPARAREMGVVDEVVAAGELVDAAARRALSLATEEGGRAAGGRGSRAAQRGVGGLVALATEGNPIGRRVMLRRAREAAEMRTRGHYPAPERILDVLEVLANKGFEASLEAEARAFGELAMSTAARRLSEVFFATRGVGREPVSGGEWIAARTVNGAPALGAEARALLAMGTGGESGVVLGKGAGHYTRRILIPYVFEALRLVMEGVPIEAVDRALVVWGFPVGPLSMFGEVGIDEAAREAIGDRLGSPAEGLAGIGPERPRGAGAGGAAKGGVAVEEIQMRCALQLVNEALHCLGEGVLGGEGRSRSAAAREGDLAAIYGLGFPPFRGGPFRYVDGLGAGEALKRLASYEVRFGSRWKPAPLLVEMARANGRFYEGR